MIKNTSKCNKIEVVPVVSDYGFTFYFCNRCRRDLEVTTTATGFRHLTDTTAADLFDRKFGVSR